MIGAWVDDRVFHDGRCHFEGTPDELRTFHRVAGGQFLVTGVPLQGYAVQRRSSAVAIADYGATSGRFKDDGSSYCN